MSQKLVQTNYQAGYHPQLLIGFNDADKMLTELSLSNFKCFEITQLFKLNKVTLLTGYNGRGKSTVFQSLLLLGQSYQKKHSLKQILFNGCFTNLGEYRDVVSYAKEEKKINISIKSNNVKLESVEQEHQEDSSVILEYERDSDRTGILSDLIVDGKSRFSEVKSLEASVNSDGKKYLTDYPASIDELVNSVSYISAYRQGPVLYEEKAQLEETNPAGSSGEHALEVIVSTPDAIQRISDCLQFIMEGDVCLQITGINEDSNVLNPVFSNQEGFVVKAVNHGFGYGYVLSVLTTLFHTNKGMLFIENPEAHLHPSAQSRLITVICNHIKNKDIQLFVETHSEHVINAVRLFVLKDNTLHNDDINIYFFDKDKNPELLTIDTEGQISNWPRGFFDQQECDMAEILKLGLFKA